MAAVWGVCGWGEDGRLPGRAGCGWPGGWPVGRHHSAIHRRPLGGLKEALPGPRPRGECGCATTCPNLLTHPSWWKSGWGGWTPVPLPARLRAHPPLPPDIPALPQGGWQGDWGSYWLAGRLWPPLPAAHPRPPPPPVTANTGRFLALLGAPRAAGQPSRTGRRDPSGDTRRPWHARLWAGAARGGCGGGSGGGGGSGRQLVPQLAASVVVGRLRARGLRAVATGD